MCTYNGARYLQEQLDSFTSQTRIPDELVVCDDCSSDSTMEILRVFASEVKFPVRIFVNESKLGSTKNFEKAISLCEGNIIFLADQDDVWLPEKLSRIEAEFSRSPDLAGVLTDAVIVDEFLEPIGFYFWQATNFRRLQQKRAMKGKLGTLLKYNTSMAGATFAFRAELMELVLPIPDYWTHDAWIVLIIAALARIRILPEPLNLWRQHEQQQLGSWEKESFIKQVQRVSWKNFSDDTRLASRQYESARERISVLSLKSREYSSTLAELSGRLDERSLHLNNRADLSRRRTARLVPIAREIATLRYSRYSSGLKSVARDLFFRV